MRAKSRQISRLAAMLARSSTSRTLPRCASCKTRHLLALLPASLAVRRGDALLAWGRALSCTSPRLHLESSFACLGACTFVHSLARIFVESYALLGACTFVHSPCSHFDRILCLLWGFWAEKSCCLSFFQILQQPSVYCFLNFFSPAN